ncbi:hypothetical protein EXIGLDRAFT_725148 [Exidia glandulosa HHB12029]|uniref:Uncharacterized protein n=1 Tax=Exidia glandulosa HHB12029 TaxID=1314781 RepID=A0A165E5Z7_EXIGL|nr:hypothetical protein EXIGLDRAFT_725148 [Exidia glandulosa HHB12029]
MMLLPSSYLVDYRRFQATRRQQGLPRVLRPDRPQEPWRSNAHSMPPALHRVGRPATD